MGILDSTTRLSAGNAPYSARLLFLLLIPAFITKNLHSALDQTVSLIYNSLVHHFLDINAGLKLVFSIRSDNILCAKKLWKYLLDGGLIDFRPGSVYFAE